MQFFETLERGNIKHLGSRIFNLRKPGRKFHTVHNVLKGKRIFKLSPYFYYSTAKTANKIFIRFSLLEILLFKVK